jgi:hypothetical protein
LNQNFHIHIVNNVIYYNLDIRLILYSEQKIQRKLKTKGISLDRIFTNFVYKMENYDVENKSQEELREHTKYLIEKAEKMIDEFVIFAKNNSKINNLYKLEKKLVKEKNYLKEVNNIFNM